MKSSKTRNHMNVFGVAHGFSSLQVDFSRAHEPTLPSQRLLDALAALPKGSRVGIEWMSESDWKLVKGDLYHQASDLLSFPSYDQSTPQFWNALAEAIAERDHTVVLVESPDLMKECHTHAIEQLRLLETWAKARIQKIPIESAGKRQLRIYEQHLREKKAHTFAREEHFLSQCKNLDAIILGLGHTDPLIEQQAFGDVNYAADVADLQNPRQLVYQENRVPDPQRVLDHRLLAAQIRQLEQGTLTDRTPDYIGTFSFHQPHKGYFEIFVNERNSENISGTILDTLGTSNFRGTIERTVNFQKKYEEPHRGSNQSLRYCGQWADDVALGVCTFEGCSLEFALMRYAPDAMERLLKLPVVEQRMAQELLSGISPRTFCAMREYHVVESDEQDPLICSDCETLFGKDDESHYRVME